MTIHPAIAREISAAVNSRSVAQNMIDVVMHAKPYVHADFLYWAQAHREATAKLVADGHRRHHLTGRWHDPATTAERARHAARSSDAADRKPAG